MSTLTQCLAVGFAGFLGALARMLVGQLCGRLFNVNFPVGTLIINVTGSFLLGLVMMIASRGMISETARLALAVGFLGAYTTFSTFMYESNKLLESGSGIEAMFNLIGSLVLGLIAVRVGIWLGGQ